MIVENSEFWFLNGSKNVLDKSKKYIYQKIQEEVGFVVNHSKLEKSIVVLSGVAVVAVLKGTAAPFL
jgi:hypothetical protein